MGTITAVVSGSGKLPVGKVGPGYRCSVHLGLTGALANDDTIVITIVDGSNNSLLSSSKQTFGIRDQDVQMGTFPGAGFVHGTPFFQFVQINPGDPVSLVYDQLDITGASQDSGSSSGWTWDPTGALHTLVEFYGSHILGADSSSGTQGILNAVQKTFQNTP